MKNESGKEKRLSRKEEKVVGLVNEKKSLELINHSLKILLKQP